LLSVDIIENITYTEKKNFIMIYMEEKE